MKFNNHKNILLLTIFFSFLYFNAKSQSFWEKSHIGVGIGVTRYQGDIPMPYNKFIIQGNYTYELTNHINIRGQLAFGSLGASDDNNIQDKSMDRPHAFNTRIQEVSILGEYNLFSMNDGKKWTPYGFIGLGFFHFVPYRTIYDDKSKRFVDDPWPVSSTKKLDIPFGLGFRFALTDNIRLFVEGNYRYTTTDEIDGYQPTSYTQYKRAKANDYFLSGVVGVSFRLGGDYKSHNNGGGKSKHNNRNCPPVY